MSVDSSEELVVVVSDEVDGGGLAVLFERARHGFKSLLDVCCFVRAIENNAIVLAKQRYKELSDMALCLNGGVGLTVGLDTSVKVLVVEVGPCGLLYR